MTVSLDKKQIHIGWPAAISILAIGIPFIWGCATVTNTFFQKQDKIYNAVVRYDKNDSIRAVDINNIKGVLSRHTWQIDSVGKLAKPGFSTFNQAIKPKFYIEQRVGNRLILKEANPNRL